MTKSNKNGGEQRNGCDVGPLGYDQPLVLGCNGQAPRSLVPPDSAPHSLTPGLDFEVQHHEPDLLGPQLPG